VVVEGKFGFDFISYEHAKIPRIYFWKGHYMILGAFIRFTNMQKYISIN
jgi:hypothetical protein